MKMTLILAGLVGLSLLVGCAIVPLEPYGMYGHHHGGYHGDNYRGGYDYGRPGPYDRGYYDRGYHRGGPGYWR